MGSSTRGAPSSFVLVGCALALAPAACSALVGADFDVELATGGDGGAGAAGSTGGDGGGTGGAGGPCDETCYEGPEGTEDVGTCKAGSRGCGEAVECAGQVLPAAENCATEDDESCDGEAACSGTPRWARRLGAGLADQALEIGVFPNGDVFVAGFVRGVVDLGGGPTEPSAEDPEGADAFVVRLDASGEHVWSKRFAAPGSQSIGAAEVDPKDGSVVVAGNYAGGLDLGGGPLPATAGDPNVFLAKLDGKSGEHVWSRGFGSEAAESVGDFGVSASGLAVLAGGFGGTLALGDATLTTTGENDAFVAALSTEDGSVLWARAFGAPDAPTSGQFAEAAAVSKEGAVVVAGRYHVALVTPGGTTLPGSADGRRAFVIGLSKEGEETFAFGLDAPEGSVRGATFDGEFPVLAGVFSGTLTLPDEGGTLSSQGALDLWVAKLDPAGKLVFGKAFGGPGNDFATDVAADGAGQVVVAGRFEETLDFGGTPLASAGETDLFVAKLSPSGVPTWSLGAGDAAIEEATTVAVGQGGEVLVAGSATGSLILSEDVTLPASAPPSADAIAVKLSP